LPPCILGIGFGQTIENFQRGAVAFQGHGQLVLLGQHIANFVMRHR
jgi:hypothetical protein